MVGFAFGLSTLTDIVKQTASHGDLGIGTDFRCDHAGKDCNFLGVVQHVLTVAGSEVKSSESPDEFRSHVVDSEVEDDLFTLIDDDAADFLADLSDHFLNA